MRISAVNNQNPNFMMAKPANMRAYTKTVEEGLKVLDKNMGFIIHNSSVPAKKAINTGIGSLLSVSAAISLIPFLKEHGFSTIQQDPDNLRSNDPSPYAPLTPDKNIYMIPLERLASQAYDNILSARTLKAISTRANLVEADRVNYNNVSIEYDHALWEAFTNFKTKSASKNRNKTIEELSLDFEIYKDTHFEEFEPHAIYEILAKHYYYSK